MNFKILKSSIAEPLSLLASVAESRQSIPILSNIYIKAENEEITLIATDLEIELKTYVEVSPEEEGLVTVPARKLFDICKEIPDQAKIDFALKQNRLELKSGRFRSTLSTLPADDFPTFDESEPNMTVEADSKEFKLLLDKTSFAMAHQDVRFFLNGMLIESGQNFLRAVATDGHRLALSNIHQAGLNEKEVQVILPRKAVLELQRLLHELGGSLTVSYTHLTLPTSDLV